MSWIANNPPGSARLERLLGARPELLSRYKAFYGTVWEAGPLPRRVLEICRQRIAAIHGCAAEQRVHDAQVDLSVEELQFLAGGDIAGFGASERVALALAEKIPYRHHEIDDDEVARAEREFGAAGAVALLVALSFFDVTCRWQRVFSIDSEPAAPAKPPLLGGALA